VSAATTGCGVMKPEVSRVPPLDVLVTCVGQPVSGTYDLLVWGLDKHHSSQETDVMLRYGDLPLVSSAVAVSSKSTKSISRCRMF
jgi:hypothetical protein